MISARRLFVASAFLSLPLALVAQDIASWAAPPYWSPPATIRTPEKVDSDVARVGVESIEAVPTPPLALTGINPCRIVDTRGNGFTGAYGPPALTQGSPRNFTLSGQCGISGAAQAVSLNITVTNTQGPGFILIYPQGGAQPTVSTLNYVAGQTVANAAVVPLGTAGGVTVIAGVSGTDLIIDTNGYYAPQAVVNTVNGLSGAVTLAAGSNVSITPSGQTLTIASNGGPGGLLPAGSFGQTLRHDGISWVASNALRNDGTDISVSGVLRFPAAVRATAGLSLLFHNTGIDPSNPNTFFGIGAGNLSTASGDNTAFGGHALQSVTGGDGNTAVGFEALQNAQEATGNTASGSEALRNNTIGNFNTAYGSSALEQNTTGGGNIALGEAAGFNLTSGNNNMYLGNEGVASESGTVRLGSGSVHTRLFVAGVLNSTVSGASVLISGTGQLGIPTSSARFKEDIEDMADASSALLKLRPVTFRYKGHADDPLQYGLVAEEVEKVFPELVLNDPSGQPQTVLYHELPAMLLNELEKQEKRIEQEDAEIASLRQQLKSLEERLSEVSRK